MNIIFAVESDRLDQFLDLGNHLVGVEVVVRLIRRGNLPVEFLGRHGLLEAQAQATLVALDADDTQVVDIAFADDFLRMCHAALRKLAAVLPQPMTLHLSRAADRVQRREDGLHRVQVLETITDAWGRSRKLRIGYRSPGRGALRERVVAPYALEPTANGIYLIGYDDSVKDIRTFKLDRLETALVLDEPYTLPPSFDAEAHLATRWGIMTGTAVTAVALQFTPAAAPLVRERRWHPTQHLQSSVEGGVTLRVRVSEPLEMQPWIRSWGAQVRVLEPDWLRDRIAAELKEAAAQYV